MSYFSGVPKVSKIIAIIGTLCFFLYQLAPNGNSLDTTFRPPSTSLLPPLTSPQPPSNRPSISDKVAVIIESRPWTSFVPLILHFSAVLGPSWPIVLYTSLPSTNITSSAPFRREMERGKVQVRALPEGTQFNNHTQVSAFLTSPWLWEQLAPAKHALLFQADSMLCVNSLARVEDFFEYDFVGAPIRTDWGEGFNGGLSLRNRELCLRIASGYSWEEAYREETERRQKGQGGNNGSKLDIRYEDQWFYKCMLDLGAKLPSVEVALTFAVETIDYEQPLGFHKPGAVFPDTVERIREWCPEIELTINEGFLTTD